MALKIAFERGETMTTPEIVTMSRLFSGVARLGKNETTEIIKAREQEKDEIILFERLIDAFRTMRANDKAEGK